MCIKILNVPEYFDGLWRRHNKCCPPCLRFSPKTWNLGKFLDINRLLLNQQSSITKETLDFYLDTTSGGGTTVIEISKNLQWNLLHFNIHKMIFNVIFHRNNFFKKRLCFSPPYPHPLKATTTLIDSSLLDNMFASSDYSQSRINRIMSF